MATEHDHNFRHLAEILPDGLLIYKSGAYVYANPAADKILGADYPGQLIGKTPFDLTHPDDHALLRAHLSSVSQGKTVPLQEMRARTLDGQVIHVESTATGYEGPDGFCIQVVLRNITIRKLLQDSNRRSDERFRVMIEGVKDYAIIFLDAHGRIITWNSGAKRIKGYMANEIIGRSMAKFFTEEDQTSGHPALLLHLAQANGSVSDEGWRVRKDGSLFWASMVLTALYDEQGGIEGYTKITRDMTERKHIEEKIAQSERRFRSLVENAGNAIIELSIDGRILAWNLAAEYLSGWGRSQADGQNFVAFCIPHIGQHVMRDAIQKALDGETIRDTQCPILTQVGTQRTFSWNIDRILGEYGRVSRLIIVGQDITVQKQAETELRRLNERLATVASDLEQVREQEQKRIAREIHDELGHQLAAIKLEISLLTNLVRTGKKSNLSKADECAARLRSHLDDTIATVRSLAQRIRPDLLDRIGLIEALESQVADFKYRTGLDARFICDLAMEKVEGNNVEQTTLYRITQEALTNVARHAHATSVEVRFYEMDSDWVLEINDNGRGFDTSRPVSEQSLGLRGMRERVELIRGYMSISSEEGRGTNVIVRTRKRVPTPC